MSSLIDDDDENQKPKKNPKKKGQKKRNKSDLGDDFVAPDGGWGWLVCVAGGFSILTNCPVWQSFGLIFRERLQVLNLTTLQITTIINIHPAINSLLGLFTGPIFRRYTYRQVSLISSILVSIGILLATISNSFFTLILSISVIFGAGIGLGLSATFITLNTYFEKKRRTARSVTLCVSGTGAIIMPHLANYLLDQYGFQGCLIILAGISMNSFVCSLLYQPVQWHITKNYPNQHTHHHNLQTVDNSTALSLQSQTSNNNNNNSVIAVNTTTGVATIDQQMAAPSEELKLSINNNTKLRIFLQYIMKFFDLDLLKDLKYLNLIIGLALTQFSEQNFSMLTPFFLADFHYTNIEIAILMSIQGCGDLLTRFLIPIITNKFNWNSRIYFIIGISGLTFGRIIIPQIQSFQILLIIFGVMGICKGFRTVFMGLVIPDYVQLNRLPAATGLNNFTSGIFIITCGPIVGKIRDVFNSTIMLYFLSLCSMTMIVMWLIEMCYVSYRNTHQNIISTINSPIKP